MITASLVLFHNKKSDIDRLMGAVKGSSIDYLFVIDNSSDDFFNYLQHDSIVNYRKNKNIGYGGSHNIAIREAIAMKSDYHVVLNPDIYWDGDIMATLSDYMNQHQDVGQMMPKVFYPDGRLQYLCKMIPTPMDLIFKRFMPSSWMKNRLHKFTLQFTGYDKIMNVPYLSGCFMFFRTAALKEVGLFDERFFMYPEDIDLTRRMHEKYKTIFYPYTSIVHAHGAASRTNKKMLFIHITNMIKYFNKWGWVFDSKRKKYNKILLQELNYGD